MSTVRGRSAPPAPDARTPAEPGRLPLLAVVGSGLTVPTLGGTVRPFRDLDLAASSPSSELVAAGVRELLPWYSSVHRGSGAKSQHTTRAYETARTAVLGFTGRRPGPDRDDVAILCRNATEALNHLVYRLRLRPDEVVATTVVEHHANLLPWARAARRRWVECGAGGTFGLEDVRAALDAHPRPAVLTFTGASNVTGWIPPVEAICDEAHSRGIPVVLDGAQLAPHRPIPTGPDYVAFSGHKLYAPFGAGVLIGPRATFSTGDPFLAGGGAVDLVDLDEVLWTEPPEREEAGSPNVVGAVAMGIALDQLSSIGWDAVAAHESALARRLRRGLSAIDGVRLLGPGLDEETLSVATFTVEGYHHSLVAARLSAEFAIGVRHGCFCAHPYLLRLLGLGHEDIAAARREIGRGDRRAVPGAVRASCGLATTATDVDACLDAVAALAAGLPEPVPYVQDITTGEFRPSAELPPWWEPTTPDGPACTQG